MLNQRIASGLGGVALVAFGIAIGIAADRFHLSYRPASVSSAENQHRMALQHLQDLFALDDAQVNEIDQIFRRHQGAIIQSWMTIQPHLQSAIESVHLSMSEVLRPEQREAFRTWMEEQSAHGVIVIDHRQQHQDEPPH